MRRPYIERRNSQVMVLIDRRKMHPKDVPDQLLKMGFGLITYAAVRQIVSRLRKTRRKRPD